MPSTWILHPVLRGVNTLKSTQIVWYNWNSSYAFTFPGFSCCLSYFLTIKTKNQRGLVTSNSYLTCIIKYITERPHIWAPAEPAYISAAMDYKTLHAYQLTRCNSFCKRVSLEFLQYKCVWENHRHHYCWSLLSPALLNCDPVLWTLQQSSYITLFQSQKGWNGCFTPNEMGIVV